MTTTIKVLIVLDVLMIIIYFSVGNWCRKRERKFLYPLEGDLFK